MKKQVSAKIEEDLRDEKGKLRRWERSSKEESFLEDFLGVRGRGVRVCVTP